MNRISPPKSRPSSAAAATAAPALETSTSGYGRIRGRPPAARRTRRRRRSPAPGRLASPIAPLNAVSSPPAGAVTSKPWRSRSSAVQLRRLALPGRRSRAGVDTVREVERVGRIAAIGLLEAVRYRSLVSVTRRCRVRAANHSAAAARMTTNSAVGTLRAPPAGVPARVGDHEPDQHVRVGPPGPRATIDDPPVGHDFGQEREWRHDAARPPPLPGRCLSRRSAPHPDTAAAPVRPGRRCPRKRRAPTHRQHARARRGR